MNFIISLKNDATKAFCVSVDNSKSINLPNLFFGDVLHIELTPADGQGGFADFFGRSDVALSIGVGDPTTRNLYSSATFEFIGGTYHADFEINTTSIGQEIDGESFINRHLEIKLGKYGGDTHTLLQMPVKIQNQLIP